MFIKGSAHYRKPGSGEQLKALGQLKDPKAIEDAMLDNLDLKNQILSIAQELLPLIGDDAKVGDIAKMLDKVAPVAVLRLVDTVVNSSNEKVRTGAAKDLLYMAGYKPVERSVNINDSFEKMSDKQIDAFLKNSLDKMNDTERKGLIELLKDENGVYIPASFEVKEL